MVVMSAHTPGSPSRKERFEFRITRELLAKVEARAGREGVSRAEIVTRAIEAYLAPEDLGKVCQNLSNKIEKLKTMLLEENQSQTTEIRDSIHEQT